MKTFKYLKVEFLIRDGDKSKVAYHGLGQDWVDTKDLSDEYNFYEWSPDRRYHYYHAMYLATFYKLEMCKEGFTQWKTPNEWEKEEPVDKSGEVEGSITWKLRPSEEIKEKFILELARIHINDSNSPLTFKARLKLAGLKIVKE